MHIVRTEEFHHLKLELDTLRPKQPLNNFMDAAAIVHLILLIQEFDRGDSDRLPLFFASSPLFDQAVRRAGVGRLLVSKRLAEAGSVLRNSEYFLLRAIFSARDFIKGRCRQDTLFERLRSILAAIIESRQSSKAIDEVLLPEIESLLQEFRTFNLFDKVWLPAFAEENEEIMEELAAVVAHLDDQSVQHAIKQSIGVTERALAKGVRQYRLASLVWTGLQRAISALAIPGVMDHDLAQFGLSHTAKMQATELMSAFTEGGSLARSSMLSVIDMCLNESESAADPLQSALAVLWVLHLDRELLEVVQDRRALGAVLATPVLLMEAAALLRLEESSR